MTYKNGNDKENKGEKRGEEKGKEKIRPGELNNKKDVADILKEKRGREVDRVEEAHREQIKCILEKQAEDVIEADEEPSGEIIFRKRYDEMRTVSLDVTEKKNVGGIGIRYVGMDTEQKGVYEVLINKSVVGKTHVEEKGSEKVEVPDFGFSVTISPVRVREMDSIANIEVKIQPKQKEDYVYYVVKKVDHGDRTATYDLAPLSKEDAKKVQELDNRINAVKSGGSENLVRELESEKNEILVGGDILTDYHSYTGPVKSYEVGDLVSKDIEKEEGFQEPGGAMSY